MFPAATSLRSRTPAMIASAITPAPMTPSVDPRSGLICGLYELDLLELATVDIRTYVRVDLYRIVLGAEPTQATSFPLAELLAPIDALPRRPKKTAKAA